MDPSQILNLLVSNPLTTLYGSLLLAAAIIVLDISEGYSFNLPGPGQLGLGGLIAVAGSTIWFYSQGGFQAIAGEVAGGIFGGVIIGSVIAVFMSRKN